MGSRVHEEVMRLDPAKSELVDLVCPISCA